MSNIYQNSVQDIITVKRILFESDKPFPGLLNSVFYASFLMRIVNLVKQENKSEGKQTRHVVSWKQTQYSAMKTERELNRNRNLTAEQFLIFFCVTGRERQNVIVEKSHLSLSDSFIELLHLFPGSFKVQRNSGQFDKYNFNSSTQFLNYTVDAEIVDFQVWRLM